MQYTDSYRNIGLILHSFEQCEGDSPNVAQGVLMPIGQLAP